jgi:hypothetical protein
MNEEERIKEEKRKEVETFESNNCALSSNFLISLLII